MADAAETTPRQAALKEVYVEATKALRENHRDEFNSLRVEGMKARGFDWAPALTEEEKAEQQVAELLTKFPHLADQIAGGGQGKRASETPTT
jgi:hypothetical protein